MSVPGTMVLFPRLLVAGAVVVSLAAPDAAAARARLKLVAPSAAVQPSHTLRVAGQLANVRRQTAFRVRVRSARVPRTRLRTHLPLSFRQIRRGRAVIVQLRFRSRKALQRQRFRLVMRGTYRPRRHAHRQRRFVVRGVLRLPPRAPGESSVEITTAPALEVKGAPFPPRPPRFEEEEVNGSRWTVPTGSRRPATPTPSTTRLDRAPARGARASQAGTVIFRANRGLGVNASTTVEPTGAVNASGIVFAAGNWFAAYSTNGGATFNQLNPTTIFPNDAIGFCCDQVIQYVPRIDRFIWLLQGTNGYRLASASPATVASSGGTAWTYWNLPSTLFGQPSGTGLDYPDVAVGNNALYLSWDNGFPGCPKGCLTGLQVSRIGLSAIQAAGTITIDYTHPEHSAVAWGSHLVQDTGDEIFWAGHTSNSQMRVFSLREGSNTYFWRDIGVSTWANNALSSTTPDNQNWLAGSNGFPGNAVLGGTRSGNHVWFAWDAGTDRNFAQPHIEMVDLDRNKDFARSQQVQIWNRGFAFAYPALATNQCTGELGLSLETGGGGGRFENHAVGFWGDFLVYLTTNTTVGTTRFGDYVTIRDAPATARDPGNLFAAFGYGLTTAPPPATGTLTDVRYVLFGRPPASCNPG
jgi:hypothetical protein